MSTHIYLAPAGHGKTTYVLERIRQARAADPLAPISVVLPNQVQVSAFRHRLSAGGGALGVSVGTFYALYPEILAWTRKPEPRLPETAQYRLIRSIVARLVDEGRLCYYAPLRDKPGFVVALRALLEELKRAGIRREKFRQAIQALPDLETRLLELAEIYDTYQDWLLDHKWADTEGQGWLAALALERQPDLGCYLCLLVVDGFDEFNPTQLDVLKLLAGRAAETVVTLTGTRQGLPRLALRRFTRELQAVSLALNVEPEPLPDQSPAAPAAPLAHLEANLFEPQSSPFPLGDLSGNAVRIWGCSLRQEQRGARHPQMPKRGYPLEDFPRNLLASEGDEGKGDREALTLLEVQNRAEEARAALRWLKARMVRDNMAPTEVALVARDLTPYRPFIEEIAAEFGLSLHLRGGLNLATNPVIAAILLLLSLPIDETDGAWARRPVLDAWRSPYLEELVPGVDARAANCLDAVARQGLVLRGLDQWRQALTQSVGLASSDPPPVTDEDLTPPDQLTQAEALALQSAFEAFVSHITPPPQATMREYAAFVEDLIGDDPRLTASFRSSASPPDEAAESPSVVSRARDVGATARRDVAALRGFKDVLRSLVLAESFLGETGIFSYQQFYQELRSAVQGATYYLPPPEPLDAALPVLSVLNARGLSFRAVALIGLAEGDFPRPEREDILLREEDRRALARAGLATLETRLRGDEITFFYQAITRARERLLLCRPYLADDGQTWEASPYWEEVRRLVDVPVEHLRPEDPLPLAEVASPGELTRALAQLGLDEFEPSDHLGPADLKRLLHSAAVLRVRLGVEPGPAPDDAATSLSSVFEGDLTRLAGRLAAVYGPGHVWSSSRLEAYGLCPLHFWLGQDLALEPHQPPEEGFDVFILGSMYHEILEEVYRQAGAQADAEHLLELLPAVARQVFDKAPDAYGFRPTPLWDVQRRELEQILAQTLTALVEATADSVPVAQEQVFGMRGQPPLVVRGDGDEFRVRGFIDRVDRDADGRLCIIDYKSGSTPISGRDLVEGRRLQIALYALAARDALALGDIGDGFYWHITSAKTSSLKLKRFEGGVNGALDTAIAHAFKHVAGVRAGRFPPSPPAAGCPGHCPGASFCWQYQAKGW
jgi:superfamily I DNA/RNA helicase